MIYTVTFNPAIDYVVAVDQLSSGKVNRAEKEEIFIGGKGINVSWVLNNLGIKTKALGFIGGFTGEAIEQKASEQGILTDFVQLKNGFSRINVKIKTDVETELNGQGPNIEEDEIDKLFNKLESIRSGDILVLAGSVPKTLPKDIYEQILKKLSDKGVLFVVDATNDLLLNVLKYKPFMIKPNNFELGEIFKVKIESKDQVVFYAKKLKELGAVNVLVSMAEKGSVLLDEYGKVHSMGVPKGKVVNSVGAGDSMVAGFIAGYLDKRCYDYALKLGTAAGSATAFSPGIAEKDKIEKLLNQLLKY